MISHKIFVQFGPAVKTQGHVGEDLLFVYHVSLHHEDFRKCNRNDLAILSRVKANA